MRAKVRRHLGALLGPDLDVSAQLTRSGAKSFQGPTPLRIPSDFNPHQYAILLLTVAAEIEHALMLEYIYSAYSLGGSQVPVDKREMVSRWRETILGVAKEEMGHLMTVQNLLMCLGGPLNLDREDYPWDSEFYPFQFQLRPLSRKALAQYVFAESPPDDMWGGAEADQIRRLAQDGAGASPLHRVGALYALIDSLLSDPAAVRDADFDGTTFPCQANWDEWGRGYRGGARGNVSGQSLPGTPDLLVLPVTARTDALSALRAVAEQGEANTDSADTAPSHFARFLRIYREFPEDDAWKPTKDVPTNPFVGGETESPDERDGVRIENPVAATWAHLLNVRYRLLLTNLRHSYEYPGNLTSESQSSPRSLLIHSTFGEMYNIRALSGILVQTPLSSENGAQMAGPPFQVPFTMKLPPRPVDRWELHLDLLHTCGRLVDELLQTDSSQSTYLQSMKEIDRQAIRSIRTMLKFA
jgi:hypothetical protein